MIDRIALILSIIGGINLGSIAIFQFDIFSWIGGGQGSAFSRIIYAVIALGSIWCISLLFRNNLGPREERIEA